MTLPKSIKELRNPETLKSGHIAKMSKGRIVVVKRNKYGKALYKKASKNDIKCSKTLKKNVKKMLDEVKSKKNKRVKSYPQALAIAYTKTKQSYPKCELVKSLKKNYKPKLISKYTIKRKMIGGKRRIHKVQTGAGKKRVKLQRKILKLLIKKGYILKQNGTDICSPVKSNKIKSLYNKSSNIPIIILHIRNKYKSGKLNFNEFFNKVNEMIQNCKGKSKTTSHPIISSTLKSYYISGFRYSGSYKTITYDANEIKPELKDRVKMNKLYEFVKTLP